MVWSRHVQVSRRFRGGLVQGRFKEGSAGSAGGLGVRFKEALGWFGAGHMKGSGKVPEVPQAKARRCNVQASFAGSGLVWCRPGVRFKQGCGSFGVQGSNNRPQTSIS